MTQKTIIKFVKSLAVGKVQVFQFLNFKRINIYVQQTEKKVLQAS